MSSSDAEAFIKDVQRQRGVPLEQPPVNSIDELLDVLANDQIARFANAERLVAGKPGVDAMALHGTIELAWSDDLSTLALILGELKKRADVEIERLKAKRESGSGFTEADAKDLEQNQKNAEFNAKGKGALEVLAQDHLRAAGKVVAEAHRQFPKDPLTFRVVAYYSLLTGDWLQFDAAMGWLKAGEAKDAGLVYLRALEALSRFAVRKDAAVQLRNTLAINPKMARAQAKLVLVEDGADAKYAEFEKLKALVPQHPVVWLAGPSISSDYELSGAFRKAREARQPGPAEAPGSTPAAVAPAATAPTVSPAPPAPAPPPPAH